MIKYLFPEFETVIVNPTVINVKATDNLSEKECVITFKLIDLSGSVFGVTKFPKYHYEDSWTDQDIHQFIETELKKFIVE